MITQENPCSPSRLGDSRSSTPSAVSRTSEVGISSDIAYISFPCCLLRALSIFDTQWPQFSLEMWAAFLSPLSSPCPYPLRVATAHGTLDASFCQVLKKKERETIINLLDFFFLFIPVPDFFQPNGHRASTWHIHYQNARSFLLVW